MAGDWRPESESRCYWWLTQLLLLGFDSKARTRALVALVAAFRTVACGPKGAALLITLLLDGGVSQIQVRAHCVRPSEPSALHTLIVCLETPRRIRSSCTSARFLVPPMSHGSNQ